MGEAIALIAAVRFNERRNEWVELRKIMALAPVPHDALRNVAIVVCDTIWVAQ